MGRRVGSGSHCLLERSRVRKWRWVSDHGGMLRTCVYRTVYVVGGVVVKSRRHSSYTGVAGQGWKVRSVVISGTDVRGMSGSSTVQASRSSLSSGWHVGDGNRYEVNNAGSRSEVGMI